MGREGGLWEPFLFFLSKVSIHYSSWKQTGPALKENAFCQCNCHHIHDGFQLMNLRKTSLFLHMASSVECYHSQLSCALKFTKYASCYQRLLEKKRMFYYLSTIIYFVDFCHCPALEEEECYSSAGNIMMLQLVFLIHQFLLFHWL